MYIRDLKFLTEAIGRQFSLAGSCAGDGDEWTYRGPDGVETHYKFFGIKSAQEWTTDLLGAVVWLWNAKDWLKREAHGGEVEAYVNSTPVLQLCGDLANLTKHGEHRNRSGLDPRLGEVRFEIEQFNIKQLALTKPDSRGAFSEVSIAFQDPAKVDFRLPVLNGAGDVIGEAGRVAQDSWKAWQAHMERHGLLKRV